MKLFTRGGFLVLMAVLLILLCTVSGGKSAAEEILLSASESSRETTLQTESAPETAAETTVPSTETSAPETADETTADTQAPAETEPLPPPEPEIPAAYPVSSLVPMTGELPVIPVREDIPSFTAEFRDGRVILPSLIGFRRENICVSALSEIDIVFAEDWYPLPMGVIYAASFTGEMTEDTFSVLAGTTLTLHVSRGMSPYISVLTEESRHVYLTFDDGPHSANTASILNTLDEYGIKASFFMVGSYVKRYPEIVRDVYERGHKIGCHTYSHSYNSIYRNAGSMMNEVQKWEDAVKEAIGHIPPERLFRYPGGSTNCGKAEIHNALLQAGWRIFDWNALNNDCLLHTRPADKSDLDFMKESFIETIAYSFRLKSTPHIILMHDSYAQTAELLPWIIEYLQNLGCTFGTPDELPASWHY